MKTRVRYNFTGSVQGVGFRYRSYHAARHFGLTGWVRNEPDGSVTMEVQGERYEIDEMLRMIEQSPYIDVGDADSRVLALSPDEHSFEICD